MNGTVFQKTYDVPDINRREIFRYARCKEGTEGIDELIDGCIAESSALLTYNVRYAYYPINVTGNTVDMGFVKTESASLAKNLVSCEGVYVFSATVGIAYARLIAKYSRISPARAFILDAFGDERIESLCDAFCAELAEKYEFIRPRFSPGYGDLDISVQKDIFRSLDPVRIGITLSDSMMMYPPKSVTAIVGVSKKKN